MKEKKNKDSDGGFIKKTLILAAIVFSAVAVLSVGTFLIASESSKNMSNEISYTDFSKS